MQAESTAVERTLAQIAATRALAAEFGPAIVWSEQVDDGTGTRLIYTDTAPTLALLVFPDGAIASPANGSEEQDWTREAWEFDSARVISAAAWIVATVERAR